MTSMRYRRMIRFGLIVSIIFSSVVGDVSARTKVYRQTQSIFGIDRVGNIDYSLGTRARGKLFFSERSGKATWIGKGIVRNLWGRRQTFRGFQYWLPIPTDRFDGGTFFELVPAEETACVVSESFWRDRAVSLVIAKARVTSQPQP